MRGWVSVKIVRKFKNLHRMNANRSDQALTAPTRDAILSGWPASQDLWIFGYASLIWRPEFDILEQHLTQVQGWHRALKMWSRLNRGTPECPGLVFALLSGGSCQGMVFRTPAKQVKQTIEQLWFREMPNSVYTTKWLQCPTPHGPVNALAFTLPRSSPSYTGNLSPAQYQLLSYQKFFPNESVPHLSIARTNNYITDYNHSTSS